LLRNDAGRLREPDVPANEQADAADARVEHRIAFVARREPELLVVPKVRLAIAADVAFGADEHGGVVKARAVALDDAADDVHVVPGGESDPLLHGATIRNRFGMRESLFAAGEAIAGGNELGQHDEARAVLRGFAQVTLRRFEVAVHVLDADFRVALHDGDAHGARGEARLRNGAEGVLDGSE
jgi:hypothetical protein